jgi:serine/threonine protein kinase
MECPKCHAENPDGTRFCGNCAAPLSSAGSDAASLTKTLVTPPSAISKDAMIAGKYQIIEELGRGGMGIVYKAEDTRLKRTVALKFLPPELTHIPEIKDRFMREAQAAAALSHQNICVIHEIGEAEGRPFIAMEYVEGETLRDRIRKTPLAAEDAVAVALQVAGGLGEAHGKGIVHRDIKSANIMVTPKGRAKVMDFGLAKLRSGLSLTRSRTTLGTIAYMSPEQARGDEVDGRTDIWSLGIVLYEMLTGELPFKGDHDQAVIHAILHREPASLKKAKPDTPPGLAEVILQALAKKPAARYRTMEELAEDLEAVVQGLKPLRARPALPEKSIAVLPFINDSPDQENTYFVNGVMEEILTNLQKIKALRVISRTSVEQYRDRKKPVREIAEDLGVNYIVEGSAQKYGPAFKLRAQLILAAEETHLWGESFQQKITDVEDIFNIQTKIAESIAAKLEAVIAPQEKQLIEKIPTAHLAAYDAYLKGKFYMYNLATQDDINWETAMKFFEMAKERDHEFALAYAGIAQVWMFRQQMGLATPDEAGPKIAQAVERALELDSRLAEVHQVVANNNFLVIWDWETAESAFKKVIEINPNYPEAHALYSHLLFVLGRTEEAMKHAELSLKLDPHNPWIVIWYGADLLFDHRYDDCILFCREFYDKNPTSFWPLMIELYIALHLKEKYDEALEALKVAMSIQYKDFDHVFDQYEKLGYTGTLKLEADTLLEQSKTKYLSQTDIASVYSLAANKEGALDCLEQAHEMHDPVVPYIGVFPNYAILHNEPRYLELLRKMNLPVAK